MGRQETRIRLYDQPRAISAGRVLGEPLTALLVAGIVNPFGPTLTAVVVAGELKAGNKLPVVQLMLNPFSQEVEAVGELALGPKWQPAAVMPPLFGLPFGGCPTLLLPSAQLEADRSLALHAEFLRGFHDARDVLERVRRYPGNPWDRVSEEIRAGAEAFVASPAGDPGEEAADPLGAEEARELAGLLLSEEHMRPEFQAFLYAWDGSINKVGLPGLAEAAMSLEAFAGIFGHIARTCRWPDLPEGLT